MEAVCRRIVRVRHRGVRLGVVILRVRMEGKCLVYHYSVIEADSNFVEREVTVDPTAAAAANPPPTQEPSSAAS